MPSLADWPSEVDSAAVLVDANVLLDAVSRSIAEHEAAPNWLDASLAGSEAVGFAGVVRVIG